MNDQKLINTVIKNQRNFTSTVSKELGVTEAQAYIYGTNVKRRLLVPVTGEIFMLLVTACHKVGVKNFHGSIALLMANAESGEKPLRNYIRRMLKSVN